jgi:hypothetical protein
MVESTEVAETSSVTNVRAPWLSAGPSRTADPVVCRTLTAQREVQGACEHCPAGDDSSAPAGRHGRLRDRFAVPDHRGLLDPRGVHPRGPRGPLQRGGARVPGPPRPASLNPLQSPREPRCASGPPGCGVLPALWGDAIGRALGYGPPSPNGLMRARLYVWWAHVRRAVHCACRGLSVGVGAENALCGGMSAEPRPVMLATKLLGDPIGQIL